MRHVIERIEVKRLDFRSTMRIRTDIEESCPVAFFLGGSLFDNRLSDEMFPIWYQRTTIQDPIDNDLHVIKVLN